MSAGVLAGKTALVSGASHGMGKASAKLLAEDGATVLITGRRPELLASALEELRAQVPGAKIEALQSDATDARAAQEAISCGPGIRLGNRTNICRRWRSGTARIPRPQLLTGPDLR